MQRLILITLLVASVGCASQGEVTILHPTMVGDKESFIFIPVKDGRLPYMKFNHVASLHPISAGEVVLRVSTFSTTKDQIDPKQTIFYLVDDQGHTYKPVEQRHNRIVEKYRKIDTAHDVAGQTVRIRDFGSTEQYQMHYIEETETTIYYYHGYCELEFSALGIIKPETKSLTLVLEQEGRTVRFTWHITKNPAETTLEKEHVFESDKWNNFSHFMPENLPGNQPGGFGLPGSRPVP